MNSPSVNSAIASFLGVLGFCTQPASNPQANSVAASSQKTSVMTADTRMTQRPSLSFTDAKDRVSLTGPTGQIVLGQTYRLNLNFHQDSLSKVRVGQSVQRTAHRALEPVAGGIVELPVLHDAGGYYVEVRPLSLPSIVLDVSGVFPDGGFWKERLPMSVVPPAQSPRKLVIGIGSNPEGFSGLLTMNLAQPRWENLIPNVLYDESPALIRLDHNSIKMGVRTVKGRDVVKLDPLTGGIWPVDTGEALVEISYGGLTAPVCVVVSNNGERPDHGKSDCSDLLTPGRTLSREVRR